MKKNSPISKIIRTNCTVIEAAADVETIRFIFGHFPHQFLPVVKGLRFIGVILRDEFLTHWNTVEDSSLTAADLVSKEMVMLSPDNSLAEAKEIFDSKVFNIIPVTDEDGDLMGIVLREDVENHLSQPESAPYSFRSLRRVFA